MSTLNLESSQSWKIVREEYIQGSSTLYPLYFKIIKVDVVNSIKCIDSFQRIQ